MARFVVSRVGRSGPWFSLRWQGPGLPFVTYITISVFIQGLHVTGLVYYNDYVTTTQKEIPMETKTNNIDQAQRFTEDIRSWDFDRLLTYYAEAYSDNQFGSRAEELTIVGKELRSRVTH